MARSFWRKHGLINLVLLAAVSGFFYYPNHLSRDGARLDQVLVAEETGRALAPKAVVRSSRDQVLANAFARRDGSATPSLYHLPRPPYLLLDE